MKNLSKMKDKNNKRNEAKANNKPWNNDTLPNFGMEAIKKDSRFKDIVYDPKYRSVSLKQTKIYIDDRFKDVLTEERFSTKPILDPRGRPRSYGSKAKMNKFYSIPSSDEEDSDEEEETDKEENEEREEEESEKKTIETKDSKSKSQPSNKDVGKTFQECLLDPERDLARGQLLYSDSSDDDSTTTDEEDEEALGEFDWGELDKDAQWNVDGVNVEETNRVAVCNMDWDRIRAADLMALFSSFFSETGAVTKVTIYPSEYGKPLIKEEEINGPQQLAKLHALCKKKPENEYDNLEKLSKGNLDDDQEPSRVELEVLRVYQRNRLRYYYAVVELNSVESARVVYEHCDRCHFEKGGIFLDLRYIPDDMTFEDEVPHDECSKVPETCDLSSFETNALLHTKPLLSWDQQDENRSAAISSMMNSALKNGDLDEDVIKEYLASSEGEEESEEETRDEDSDEGDADTKEARLAKFRSLVAEIDENERARRGPALVFEDPDDVVASDDDEGDGENSKQSEKTDDEEENFTPFEKFLIKKKNKEKEKKKKKKLELKAKEAEQTRSADQQGKKKKGKKELGPLEPIQGDLALLVMDDEPAKNHFDMRKKIKKPKSIDGSKKGKSKPLKRKEEEMSKADAFKVNTSDPRFSALFSDPTYNLDPSHPRFDPESALNKFVSGFSKPRNVNISNPQEPKVQNDNSVNDLTMKMKKKFRKLK